MNPFLTDSELKTSLTDNYINQMKGLRVGGSKVLNTYRETHYIARPTIYYASRKMNIKIKTRSDELGNLWVLRTE